MIGLRDYSKTKLLAKWHKRASLPTHVTFCHGFGLPPPLCHSLKSVKLWNDLDNFIC